MIPIDRLMVALQNRYCTLAVLITVSCQVVYAQWTQSSGPYNVRTVVEDGICFYAGSDAGVFRSTDNGTSWSFAGPSGVTIYALAISAGKLFASGYDLESSYNGLFVSTNNGATWSHVDFTFSSAINCFTTRGTSLFAGANSLYRSTDGGSSWSETSTGLPVTAIFDLAANGDYLFAGTNEGVFVSTDNGDNWTQTNLNSAYSNKSFAVRGTDLFVATDHDIFRTTDDGASWTLVASGLSKYYIDAIAANATDLFVGLYGDGVFRSTDEGASWSEVNNGLAQLYVRALTFVGTDLLAGSDGGVFRSTDSGATWTRATSAWVEPWVTSLAAYGQNLLAGTSEGMFLSTDHGTTWTEVAGMSSNGGIEVITVNGENIFAGTAEKGAFVSTTGGWSWTEISEGLPIYDDHLDPIWSFAFAGGNVYAGTYGVAVSTNSGTSWRSAGLDGFYVRALAVLGINMFAGGGIGGIGSDTSVFLSTDLGASWNTASEGLPITTVHAFAISGTSLAATTEHGLYFSTDSGTSWHLAGWPIMHQTCLTFSDGRLFVGGLGVGLLTEDRSGYTDVGRGMPYLGVESLIVVGTDLFAGTNVGVWRRPLSEMLTSSTRPSRQLPPSARLGQNYPNPFNPTTTIEYELPGQSHVALKVYDLLGQEVVVLVDEVQPAGHKSVSFDASGLPSGAYYYRLTTGEYVAAKNLILLK